MAQENETQRAREEREQAFNGALEKVGAEEELGKEDYFALSILRPEPLARFQAVWSGLAAGARARLIRALRAAAEEHLQLDFSEINYLAIKDPDAPVRQAGIESSLEDRSQRLFDMLIQAMWGDPSHRVRMAAAEDLGRYALLCELEDLDEASAKTLRQTLLGAVHNNGEAPGVRAAALGSLGCFSDSQMSEELGAAFSNPDLRLGAVRGMGRSADPRWTDRLLPVLGSEDPSMRIEAAIALGEIEDERAVGTLSNAVDDPDPSVRLAVIQALGAIGGEEAREALLYVIDSGDERMREAADRALKEIEFYEDPMNL